MRVLLEEMQLNETASLWPAALEVMSGMCLSVAVMVRTGYYHVQGLLLEK